MNHQNENRSRRPLWTALRDTTFRSLRHRNYRRYFFGQIVSVTGSWMQSAALMWLLYERTGDPRWPSWILAAQVGPTVLLGAWGGSLADRYPKRSLVIVTQSVFLIHAVVLAVVVACNLLSSWLILGLMALSGVVQAVDLPARLAFVPDLIPREDLINAVGLNSLQFNSARAVGPAVTGLVFVLAELAVPFFPEGTSAVELGSVACFACNALSFVAVIVALWGITAPGTTRSQTSAQRGLVWEGFRYLAGHARLGVLVLLTLAFCIFAWPVMSILPAYTRLALRLRVETYSLLVSSVGAGALLGALATATYGTPTRRRPFLVVGTVVTLAGLCGLSRTDQLGPAVLGCAAAGFGLILFLSTGQSTMQLAIPDEKRGRVMAIWAMTLSASAPIGHLLAGMGVDAWGVHPVLWGMAGGVALVTAAMLVLIAILPRRQEPG